MAISDEIGGFLLRIKDDSSGAESISSLKVAAEQSGSSFDAVTKHLRAFPKRMTNDQTGSITSQDEMADFVQLWRDLR